MVVPKALYSYFFCYEYNSAYIPSGRKYEKEREKHTLKTKVFRSGFCLRMRHLLFSVWFLMWRGRKKGRDEQTRLKTLWFTHSNQRLLWTIYFSKFMAGKSFRKIENKWLTDKRGDKCFGQKKKHVMYTCPAAPCPAFPRWNKMKTTFREWQVFYCACAHLRHLNGAGESSTLLPLIFILEGQGSHSCRMQNTSPTEIGIDHTMLHPQQQNLFHFLKYSRLFP